METEPASVTDYLPNSSLPYREIYGRGFDGFKDALVRNAQPALAALRQEKPFYLVADCPADPAIEALILSTLTNGLKLQPPELELVAIRRMAELDEMAAQTISEDRRRPQILPMAIQPGENPAWWIGPTWVFFKQGNVSIFREQVRERASRLNEV